MEPSFLVSALPREWVSEECISSYFPACLGGQACVYVEGCSLSSLPATGMAQDPVECPGGHCPSECKARLGPCYTYIYPKIYNPVEVNEQVLFISLDFGSDPNSGLRWTK